MDEIGDMQLETQTRLLRVLSNGEFYRVGGREPIKVDVRIITATHQNIEYLVKEGTFREDLFHRLNVIKLSLPKLNERKEDIPNLVKHFFLKSSEKKYGSAYLVTSISLSIVSISLCYALISAGVDVPGLLDRVGLTVTSTSEKFGTFALAYAAHKAMSPIRFPPTVALTPVVAGWLGKKPVEDGNETETAE